MTTLENIKNQANEALALAGKATPGPWIKGYNRDGLHAGTHNLIVCDDGEICGPRQLGYREAKNYFDNFALIAASRALVPEQAEIILKLVAALNKAIEQRDKWARMDIMRSKVPYALADEDAEIDDILSGGK